MSDMAERPPVIGIRELSRDYPEVFDRLKRERQPLLITRKKNPVAVLVPIDESQVERFVISTAPGVAAAFEDAERAVEEGRTWSTDELLAEFGVGDEAGRESAETELSGVGGVSESGATGRIEAAVRGALLESLSELLGRLAPAAAREVPGRAPSERASQRGDALEQVVNGKTVLIAGASSGIGATAAFKVARAGAIPLLVARSANKLDETRRHIEEIGGTAYCYTADISDPDSIESLGKQVLGDHGAVDVLVNNAGRSIRRSIALSHDRFHDFERTIKPNYLGAIKLIMEFLPHMRERKSGHIVNVSSIGVQTKPPRFSAYVASKAALDAWIRVAASECFDDNVRFTTIHMPLVRTPMIAPTSTSLAFPTISPDEAVDLICDAIVARSTRVDTSLGLLAELAHIVAPETVDQLLAAAARLFPDPPTRETGGSGDAAFADALSFANLMRGGW